MSSTMSNSRSSASGRAVRIFDMLETLVDSTSKASPCRGATFIGPHHTNWYYTIIIYKSNGCAGSFLLGHVSARPPGGGLEPGKKLPAQPLLLATIYAIVH